jgi:hypothetical protein
VLELGRRLLFRTVGPALFWGGRERRRRAGLFA